MRQIEQPCAEVSCRVEGSRERGPRFAGRREVPPAELERAKALTESEELLARSDPEELADVVGMYATLLNDPGRINRDLDLALAVTADQVQTAAKLFAKENRIVLWYVPEGQS